MVAVEQALTVFSNKRIGVWVTSTYILMRGFYSMENKMHCCPGNFRQEEIYVEEA